MNAELTYVYCLVRTARRPVLRGIPDGVPGASDPRALEAGERLWAIVATVPARDYAEVALASGLLNLGWVGRRAMAHEAVVEYFLHEPAVLPMQMFTLFTSDARALDHVARNRARLDRILARIERQLEWGLRLTFDERAARAGLTDSRDESGSAYLARKRDLLGVARARLTEARTEADRVYRAMSREATEARRRAATEQGAPGSRLLLDAAFLVPVRRSAAFRAALRRRARTLGPSGIVVSLTGPWPPYNFIAPPSRPTRAPTRQPLRRDESVTRPARGSTRVPGRDESATPAALASTRRPRRRADSDAGGEDQAGAVTRGTPPPGRKRRAR